MGQFTKPEGLVCEARMFHTTCPMPAAYIYGPECEAETGKLMYLCSGHANAIESWRRRNMGRPVDCPVHGRIGTVRKALLLREL